MAEDDATISTDKSRVTGLRSRLGRVCDYASGIISLIFYSSIVVVLLLSAVLLVISYEIYKPLMILVVVLAAAAILYLTLRRNEARDALNGVITQVNGERRAEANAESEPNAGSGSGSGSGSGRPGYDGSANGASPDDNQNTPGIREHAKALVHSAANTAVDITIAAATETANMCMALIGIIGLVIVLCGYFQVGFVVIAIDAIAFALTFCASSILKFVLGRLVDACISRVFPASFTDENTPLKS